MSKASIIGAYNTAFGSFVSKNKETKEVTDLKTIYELMNEAGQGALKDAGVDAGQIDGIWVGSCSPSLFTNQEHLAPNAVEVDPVKLRFKAATRCEDACASSSVALYNAIYAVEAGRCRYALVIGVEKMNLLDTKGVTHALATCSHWPTEGAKGMTFPALFAEYAKGYQKQYGLSDAELAKMLAAVAALCYRNGLENPLAHFGKGSPADKLQLVTPEAILGLPEEKNPMIAPPLRLHDCSLVSDGAAAVVITATDTAKKSAKRAVEIAGIGHITERIAINVRPNMYTLMGARKPRTLLIGRRGSPLPISTLPRCTTASPSTRSSAQRLWASPRTAMGGRITWTEGSRGTTRSALTSPADSRQRDTPSGRPGPRCTPSCSNSSWANRSAWLPSGELLRSEPF
jgi:acetyl-CoA C-acetyltransferase